MSNDGVERRAEIDNTTVRALLLMHGGGALALLTFLSNTMTVIPALSRWVVWGITLFGLGLLVAVVHNHLRRKCSLAYEKGRLTSNVGVCWWSLACLYASIALFFFAGATVVLGLFLTLP